MIAIRFFKRHQHFYSDSLGIVSDLERIAFALALFSILSIVSSLIAGMYGSLSKDKRAMLTASSTALASGELLEFSFFEFSSFLFNFYSTNFTLFIISRC